MKFGRAFSDLSPKYMAGLFGCFGFCTFFQKLRRHDFSLETAPTWIFSWTAPTWYFSKTAPRCFFFSIFVSAVFGRKKMCAERKGNPIGARQLRGKITSACSAPQAWAQLPLQIAAARKMRRAQLWQINAGVCLSALRSAFNRLLQPVWLDSASSSCCCIFSSDFSVAMTEQLVQIHVRTALLKPKFETTTHGRPKNDQVWGVGSSCGTNKSPPRKIRFHFDFNEILGSKREDCFSPLFLALVQNTCSVRFSYLLCLCNFC